jgi:hypothetical protein
MIFGILGLGLMLGWHRCARRDRGGDLFRLFRNSYNRINPKSARSLGNSHSQSTLTRMTRRWRSYRTPPSPSLDLEMIHQRTPR